MALGSAVDGMVIFELLVVVIVELLGLLGLVELLLFMVERLRSAIKADRARENHQLSRSCRDPSVVVVVTPDLFLKR